MLVLSRRKGEAITIGQGDDLVEVEIVDIRGDNIRLGIKANKFIPVHRKEVYEAVQKEKKQKHINPILSRDRGPFTGKGIQNR